MAENNTDKHHKSDKYASFVLSIVAIVIAVVALAISTPRHIGEDCCGRIDLGIDYLGIIIGLLALMVTLMVGWNIWQTIDAKNYIKEFEDKTNKYEEDLQAKVNEIKEELLREFDNKEKITYNIISSLFYQSILSQQPLAYKEELSLNDYLSKAIDGLSLAKKYNDKTTIIALLEQMRIRVEKAKQQKLSEEEISDLLQRLREVGLAETSGKLVARLQSQLSTFNKPKEDNFNENKTEKREKQDGKEGD